jgi:hypothetical protein
MIWSVMASFNNAAFYFFTIYIKHIIIVKNMNNQNKGNPPEKLLQIAIRFEGGL